MNTKKAFKKSVQLETVSLFILHRFRNNSIVPLFFCELLVFRRFSFSAAQKLVRVDNTKNAERLMAQRGGQVRNAFTARSESASPAGLHIFNCN